jgi:hypothetical protein
MLLVRRALLQQRQVLLGKPGVLHLLALLLPLQQLLA